MKRQSFEKFCARYEFALTPAQRVGAMVCFDGLDPSDLKTEEELGLARRLFGNVTTIPALARDVVVWVKGARIGGSRMAAMQAYRLGNTVSLALAPGESAFALFVGPDIRLGRQCCAYAYGAAKLDEKAGRIAIAREGKDSFTIERHDGELITFETLPATQGGSAVRARSLVAAVMTEAAFFRDKDFAVNDAEIFRALAPRLVVGAQLIVESTPWAEAGLVHDLFVANHGRPTTALAMHAPTLLMRPDAKMRSVVEREQQRDEENAAREFGAEFMAAGTDQFFDVAPIDYAMGLKGDADAA